MSQSELVSKEDKIPWIGNPDESNCVVTDLWGEHEKPHKGAVTAIPNSGMIAPISAVEDGNLLLSGDIRHTETHGLQSRLEDFEEVSRVERPGHGPNASGERDQIYVAGGDRVIATPAPTSPVVDSPVRNLLLSFDDEHVRSTFLHQDGHAKINEATRFPAPVATSQHSQILPQETATLNVHDAIARDTVAAPQHSQTHPVGAVIWNIDDVMSPHAPTTPQTSQTLPQDVPTWNLHDVMSPNTSDAPKPSQTRLHEAPVWNTHDVTSPGSVAKPQPTQTVPQEGPAYNFMSRDSDSSSEEYNSSNGSDRAIYHVAQNDERLIDLEPFDHENGLLESKDLNNGDIFHRVDGVTTGDFHDTRALDPRLVSIPEYAANMERCVTPQRARSASHNPTSPMSPRALRSSASPRSPRSPTSRSETYLHTFETDRRAPRSPAPAFVVVPSAGTAKVTVTTIGLVEEENSLTKQLYLRRGLIFTLAAIMLLGVLTMVSGLLSANSPQEFTPAPVPFVPGAPTPVASPIQTPIQTPTFRTTEPVPTPMPIVSFPVDATISPAFFPPVDGKIVREETPSPTVSPFPTALRTKQPVEPTTSAPAATLDPTFPPTQAPTLPPAAAP